MNRMKKYGKEKGGREGTERILFPFFLDAGLSVCSQLGVKLNSAHFGRGGGGGGGNLLARKKGEEEEIVFYFVIYFFFFETRALLFFFAVILLLLRRRRRRRCNLFLPSLFFPSLLS